MLRRLLSTTLPPLAIALVAVAVVAPGASAASETFDDVSSAGYAPAIDALAEEGIVDGCQEQRFCPDDILLRGQMASLLTDALDLSAEASGYFADVEGTTHDESINALHEAGLTLGCSATDYCTDDPITRGQLASMLVRGLEIPPSDVVAFDDADGLHGDAINALGAAGITAGCSESLVLFCQDQPIPRWQAAIFLARSLELVDGVELAPLEERRERQAEIEAEIAAEEQRKAEEEAAKAAAEAERDRIWDALAECESGGNWSINTGNGYYGGLQFALPSWRAVGGSGYPHHHSREEQIHRAEKLLAIQGWGAWPACSSKLGYR